MPKLTRFILLLIFLISGVSYLFNNFISTYNSEIENTKNKLEGVEVAQKVQDFIIKLQRLRAYSQFEQIDTPAEDFERVQKDTINIKADIKNSLQSIKHFNTKYLPELDREYAYLIADIELLLSSDELSPNTTYQKITYAIEQLKEKMYYLGFRSKLLLESDSDKYYLVETMLKHLPNLIEVTGQIRAKTTKIILTSSASPEIRLNLKSSCMICQEYMQQIQRTLKDLQNSTQKNDLLLQLDKIEASSIKMQEYVKNMLLGDQTLDISGYSFFLLSTEMIDKVYDMYKIDAHYLSSNLQAKLDTLVEQKNYGIAIGAAVIFFISIILFSMYRSYTLYEKSEGKIKKSLTSILNLKSEIEKLQGISDIASTSLHYLAEEFGIAQGAIYLYNEENNKLYIAASFATNEMKSIIELNEGLIGEVASRKHYIFTPLANDEIKTMEEITIRSRYIATIPLLDHDKIFGVLQLGLLRDVDLRENDDFSYYKDMIIGFLRDAKNRETRQKYLELIDKYVITSKTNEHGVVLEVSEAFEKISGYSKEEIVGKSNAIIAHPDTPKEFYKKMWDTITKGEIFTGEVKNLSKYSKEYWVQLTITPSMDSYGNIIGYSAILQDISDRKKIEEFSVTDALTGLYNRRFFDQNFSKDLNIAKRDGKSLALIITDIDFFKQYNDLYGHQRGDEALRSVAFAMKKLFKRANDYVYRLGGEEFAISFYSPSLQSAMERANLLRKSIEELRLEHRNSKASKYLSVSIGISFIPSSCVLEVDELYRITDEALYRAKREGRNRVVSTSLLPDDIKL